MELPKQDREQLVQERKRERKDLAWLCFTWIAMCQVSSATLALSCRKAISLRIFRALFMSFGFKCLTCRNLERISYTYPILSNQFHFLIIITYNYNFACFPFNQSNSINISKFEIYINLYTIHDVFFHVWVSCSGTSRNIPWKSCGDLIPNDPNQWYALLRLKQLIW